MMGARLSRFFFSESPFFRIHPNLYRESPFFVYSVTLWGFEGQTYGFHCINNKYLCKIHIHTSNPYLYILGQFSSPICNSETILVLAPHTYHELTHERHTEWVCRTAQCPTAVLYYIHQVQSAKTQFVIAITGIHCINLGSFFVKPRELSPVICHITHPQPCPVGVFIGYRHQGKEGYHVHDGSVFSKGTTKL